MASWWEALPKLGIFEKCLQSGPKEALNLLASTDSDLFFWSEEDEGVCTFNVRRFHTEISSVDSVSDLQDVSVGQLKYQLIRCSKELGFRVERVSVSPGGEAVLLFAKAGLAVVKLHKRRGPRGEYGGGHETVICPTYNIDLYSTAQNCVMKIEWLDDLTFVVLSSDNILREFSLELPTHPVLSVGLSETSQPFPSASAPGMDWVDFSVLSPTTLALLQDSGDIHLLTVGGPEEVGLSEPLPMYPSAQDNYTSDATAVLALPTSLPIIVIATPSGEIHHCILLPRTQTSSGTSECLFVFERLSLEADLIEDFGTVELLPDPTSCIGYFIKHAVGIHRVLLPWAEFLNSYVSNEEFAVDVSQLQGHAVVHFLVDVESSDQSNYAAVCGVAVISDSCISNGLVCVASNGKCIVHLLQSPTSAFVQTHMEQQEEEEEEDDDQQEQRSHASPTKDARSGFPKKIASLLAHDGSSPIFHVDTSTKGKTPEESLKVLTASTQHLTDEYLANQERALIEINQKIKLLVQFRQQQLSDLQEVRDRLDVEAQQEKRVKQKLTRVQMKGDELLDRLKQAVCVLSFQSPGLSNEEQKLRKTLADMQVDLEKLTARMGLLKGKCKTVGYDLDQPIEVPTLTGAQLDYTRSVLKEQMTAITDLIAQAKAMQSCLSVKMEDTVSLQQEQQQQQDQQ